jgi:hypothetical protein
MTADLSDVLADTADALALAIVTGSPAAIRLAGKMQWALAVLTADSYGVRLAHMPPGVAAELGERLAREVAVRLAGLRDDAGQVH